MKPKLKLIKGFNVPRETPPEDPHHLGEMIERFLLTKVARDSDTKAFYRQALNQYAKQSPDWPPTEAGLIAFLAHCQDHYAASTTASYWNVLKMFLNYLERKRLIDDNPAIDISPPASPDLIPRAPAARDIAKLFDCLEGKVEELMGQGVKRYSYEQWITIRDLAVYSLLLDTGIRVDETSRLTICNLNLPECFVQVVGKRGRARAMPLGKTVRGDLKLWLSVRARLLIPKGDPANEFIFVTRWQGWHNLSTRQINNNLTRYCQEANIPHIAPHELRHAHAAYSHRNGASAEDVRRMLGHTNLTTTMRYLIVDEGRLQEHLKTSPRDHLPI